MVQTTDTQAWRKGAGGQTGHNWPRVSNFKGSRVFWITQRSIRYIKMYYFSVVNYVKVQSGDGSRHINY